VAPDRFLDPGVEDDGGLGGAVLAQGILSQPATEAFSDWMLVWALFWRGLIYGVADGLLLLAFPWIVVWRSFRAHAGGWPRKLGAAAAAWGAVVLVTTGYHLGYGDFRSEKIVQPNVGSTLGIVPTLVSAHPLASPISHVMLHVTAVLHCPRTDLYLPPHRSP